jgi:hypothetical protein
MCDTMSRQYGFKQGRPRQSLVAMADRCRAECANGTDPAEVDFSFYGWHRGMCPIHYVRWLRRHRRFKECWCERCGFAFTATRRDARFCSAACRQAAHRKAMEVAA